MTTTPPLPLFPHLHGRLVLPDPQIARVPQQPGGRPLAVITRTDILSYYGAAAAEMAGTDVVGGGDGRG